MRIIIHCDNQSVVNMVNNTSSNCTRCLDLIRRLLLNGMVRNRRIFVKYIETSKNILADSLLRGKMGTFWENAPEYTRSYLDEINEDIWPLRKIWSY